MSEILTEEKLTQMLKDTAKGLATSSELKSAMAAVVAEEMEKEKAASQKLLDKSNAKISELEEQAKQMNLQIKRLLATRFESIKDSNGNYNGIWPSLEMAKNFGLYVMADVLRIQGMGKQVDDLGMIRRRVTDAGDIKTVTGESNIAGAAMIPTEFLGLLPSMFGQYSVFRSDAQEWPMASDNAYAAVQTSDPVVYAPGSGTEPTESSPGFKNVGLYAKKMMTLTAVNTESTEDMAIAIGEIVGRSVVRAFARNEDKIAFKGDGTSTYFGFIGIGQALLNVNATVSKVLGIQVQATAGNWTKIDKTDVLGLIGRIEPDVDDTDCKFYCNRNFYLTVLINIALGMGGVNATEVVQTGWTPNPMFFGRKVRHVRCMPRTVAAADHFPLYLANLKQAALLGQSRAVTIDQSKDAYFKTDQIGIRGTERIAINIHDVGNHTDIAEDDQLLGAAVGLYADIA